MKSADYTQAGHAGIAALVGVWFVVSPPETIDWKCDRVRHDDAPLAEWKPAMAQRGFNTEEACEALRAEFVHRETNPRTIAREKAYRQRVDAQSWPLSLFSRFWFCGVSDWAPLDYYSHTRCAYIEHDEQYRIKDGVGDHE